MSSTTQLVTAKKTLIAEIGKETSLKQLAAALPQHITPQRFARLVVSAVNRTPKLAECRPESFFMAMMRCAEFGLLPDGRQGVLLPYGSEVQFIPMYQGLIDCACRSGKVRAITPHSVYEKDVFEYAEGLEPKFVHVPCYREEPGALIGVYAVAHMASGYNVARFMPLWRVDEHKARSPSVRNKRQSPWDTDYEAMAWKTVIKELCKFIPQSVELAELIEEDNRQYDETLPLGGTAAVEPPPRIDNQPPPDMQVEDDLPPAEEPLTFDGETGEVIPSEPAKKALPQFVKCPEGGRKGGKSVPSAWCVDNCPDRSGCPAIG